MISGAHVVIYSKDAEADRAFFRNVLGFESGPWLADLRATAGRSGIPPIR